MKPTVKEIATLAGVSPTSVSQVLNDRPIRISEETRKKILETAIEVGYEKKPKVLLDKNKNEKNKYIGVIKPDAENIFWNQCTLGMENYATANEYKIIVCNAERSIQKALEYLNFFADLKVDGIILIPTNDVNKNQNNAEVANFFRLSKIPFVLFDRAVKNVFCDFITLDNKQGAYMATEYLILAGHSKIGMINGPADIYSCRNRANGYKEALSFYRIPIDEDLIYYGDFSMESGYRASKIFINNGIKAIFTCNDNIALGVYKYAKESNMKIGEDISLVGFDDNPVCNWLNPPLTSIHQPGEAMGKKVCEILIQRITKFITEKGRDLYFVPTITERDSVLNINRK